MIDIERTSKHANEAWQEYSSGNLSFAIKLAEYGLAEEEDHGPLWEVLGLAQRDLGRTEEALDSLERASLLIPLKNVSRIVLADCYAQHGRRDLAKDLFLSAAISGRLDEIELLQVAAGLEGIDEPRLAMEACRRAGKLAPDFGQVHYDMGFYASRCGHPPHLVEALVRKAIELEPANIHYRIGLTSLLIRFGRNHEAHEVVWQLTSAQIQEVTCRCCLKRIANLFFDLGDEQRAQEFAARLETLTSTKSHDEETEVQRSF